MDIQPKHQLVHLRQQQQCQRMRSTSHSTFSILRLLLATLTVMGVLQMAFCFDAKKSTDIFGRPSPTGIDRQCFCQLQGKIDDCMCNVDTVDYFNNMKIFPRLQSLLQKPFFRYFQYNPDKGCPFWDGSIGKCASKNCRVKSCEPEEIPPGLKTSSEEESHEAEDPAFKYKKEAQESCQDDHEPVSKEETDDFDSKVDGTISDADRESIQKWHEHDASLINFCDLDNESCPDCTYVDLTINPERFTGYSGEASHRIWRAIYEENCFRPPKSKGGSFSAAFLQDKLQDLCLEKRAFYRAVSGLHSSITIHLCANYLLDKNIDTPFAATAEKFGPNLEEFQKRFDPELTNDQGPFWLRNLYFVYLLEMRALTKAAPYLERQNFFTGNDEEDKDTVIAVKELLNIMRSFPDHFDETSMFNKGSNKELKQEFRDHFLNISRVMDCVGCDKCKLWGKLQVTGLGTALKILFSDTVKELESLDALEERLQRLQPPPKDNPSKIVDLDEFYLTRNEIVALFNAFARISTSIQQLERFRAMTKT